MQFTGSVPLVDCPIVVNGISAFVRDQLASQRRDGIVIGLSGGVDSALCLRLSVEAVGKDRVLGLILPERESSPQSQEFAIAEIDRLGVQSKVIDITPALESLEAYSQRDAAIKEVFPEYDHSYKSKMVLPADLLRRDAFNFYTLIIQDSNGRTRSTRLSNIVFRKIASANNLKQRTRMLYLYRYAEMNNYLVCGTTNRSELIQGFFVKYGDGGVDIEPISGLYKTQVYQLAKHMNVLKEIIDRTPTPDTFSLGTTDEEFYFRMPYEKLDVFLYAWESGIPVSDASKVLGFTEDQVTRVYRDLNAKFKSTQHLRSLPPSPDLQSQQRR